MRKFLRDIWKTTPKKKRPPWKVFIEGVRSGKIKIMRKKDVKAILDNKEKKV